MTDAEIDALASDILNRVVADVNEIAPKACRILRKANGQLFLEFVGASKQGFGAFRCRYDPLPPIKKLIAESETLYDEFQVTLTDRRTNQASTKRQWFTAPRCQWWGYSFPD